MNLNFKRLSRVIARHEILTRRESDLEAQYLELLNLRERVKKAQLSVDPQKKERKRGLEGRGAPWRNGIIVQDQRLSRGG